MVDKQISLEFSKDLFKFVQDKESLRLIEKCNDKYMRPPSFGNGSYPRECRNHSATSL